jgi:hypothetical protein
MAFKSLLCTVGLLTITGTASATLLTFTDQAAFLAALPGPANTLNFDTLAAGTTIADGDTVDGISFHYDFGGVQMQVSDGFNTTSSPNFLGTDDADVLQDGDDFDLSFGPVNAIGMFFMTADEMFDNDIILSAAGSSVGLNVLDAGADLGDGGIPYFLGIIDTANPFTTASITTIGGGFFLYNVDDITTAVVPLPGALWLLLSGFAGLFAATRKAR